MSNTMDMSNPAVQDALEQDKQEALARIREQAEDFIVHACVDAGLDHDEKHACCEVPWNHETTDGPLGDAYTCSVCGELMQVG